MKGFTKKVLILILVLTLLLPTNIFAEGLEMTWIPIYPKATNRALSGFRNGFASYTDAHYSIVFDIEGNILNCMDQDFVLRGGNVNGRFKIRNIAAEKTGYCDTTGKVIIPAIYDEVSSGDFSDGYNVVKNDGWINVIDKDGNKLFPDKTYKEGVDSIQCIDGFIIFSPYYTGGTKEKIYYIQDNNSIKFVGEYPRTFNTGQKGLLCVSDGNYYGVIDKDGKVVVPIKYGNPIRYSEGLAVVYNQNTYRSFFVDKTGKQAFNGSWVAVDDFKDGFSIVFSDNYCIGIIDKTGKQVVPYQKDSYNSIHFNEGLMIIFDSDNHKYGIINAHTGKVVVEPKYDLIEAYSEGFTTVKIQTDKKHISNLDDTRNVFARYIYNCGVIDANGNVIIPADGTYNSISPCKDGMIGVGHYYLKELIHGSEADAYNFDAFFGFIDTKGSLVQDLEFDSITNFENNVAITIKDGMLGVLRKSPKAPK